MKTLLLRLTPAVKRLAQVVAHSLSSTPLAIHFMEHTPSPCRGKVHTGQQIENPKGTAQPPGAQYQAPSKWSGAGKGERDW